MDFSVSNRLSGSLPATIQGRTSKAYDTGSKAPLSPQTSQNERTPANQNPGPQILSENQQVLDNGGYRLTRTFLGSDGRSFTKVEEFALTPRGSRKTVVSQNSSGSITQYEEVLDRENSGNFRRTQRFKDASGEVLTTIAYDYKVTDPFVLTGGQSTAPKPASPYESFRGTQLDLTA